MSRSLLLSLLVLFAGCSSSGDAPPPTGATPRERVLQLSSRLAVAELAPAVRTLRALAEAHGGYVAASQTFGESVSLDLRVPTADLAELRAQLDVLDPSRTETETSEDVTAAHADLSARLVSARATEARLLALTAERTSALTEVLAMETELLRIRDRIESLEAEERALSRSVELAQVHLELEVRSASFGEAPLEAIAEAFVGGARFAAGLLLLGAVMGSAVAPMGLLVVLLALLARMMWRRFAPA